MACTHIYLTTNPQNMKAASPSTPSSVLSTENSMGQNPPSEADGRSLSQELSGFF
jgi:hypothetical protein